MRTGARNPRRDGVFSELAARIRSIAREEHLNSGSGVERFKVIGVAPLQLEQLHGELVLEDGDPDLSLGKALVATPPALGDVVWVARSAGSGEFHAFDVVN